uniref:Uncharacterized protein n=1 Tax=Fagus sylvatica TaxID=28930 RepID=A0A2N9GF61_FAGSY
MNGGFFQASKLRQARLHALSRATGVLGLAAHAPPPHSHSRTRSSGLRNRKVAPPLESSSANLPFGGGADSIGVRTRLHAPEKVSETMFTRSSAAASFEAQNGGFPAPIQETGTTSGLFRGRSIIWRWKRLHRRPHSPSRLRRNSLRASTRGHAAACVRHTRPRSWHTPEPRVASLCSCIIPYRQSAATSSCHEAGKKKEKSLVRRNEAPLRSKFILKAFMASPRS